MSVCEYCGQEFEEDEAELTFESECPKSYRQLTKTLCADCAIEAIENEENGVYYEICDNCGTQYDPFELESELMCASTDDDVTSDMFDECLCFNCFMDKYDEYKKDMKKYDEEDAQDEDDENDGECISLSQAAEIWFSHGEDEDYMFGYTEEELRSQL